MGPHARLGGLLCALTLAGLAIGGAPAARAGEPGPQARAHVVALRADLEAQARAPADAGVDGVLATAHRQVVRPRLGRLRTALKDLDRDGIWVGAPAGPGGPGPKAPAPSDAPEAPDVPDAPAAPVEPDAPDAPGPQWLRPDQWTGAVHKAASAYTEMAQIVRGYRRYTVGGERLEREWLRANPEPLLYGPTPAGAQAARVEGLIRWYVLHGKPIPTVLLHELERWRALDVEQRIQREADHRAWLERRRLAREEIAQTVARTRAALEGAAAAWQARMDRVRAFVADAQVAEEGRLEGLLPPEEAARAPLLAVLGEMAAGRTLALAAPEEPVPAWATRVRQGWLAPRARLLALLARAGPAAPPAAD